MSGTPLKIIIIIAAVLYYVSFAAYLAEKRHKAFAVVSKTAWSAAWIINLGIVINNYFVNGYVPFVSMFQVLTFLAMCFGPILIYMVFARKAGWMRPYFISASAIVMTGLCFMNADAHWEYPPALQSPWFVPHVLVYMIAYCMGLVCFLIAVTALVTKDKERKKELDAGVYDCVCVVFPFMTFGLFFGAIWANEIWGAFWSWDNKECWSLVTWLTYMLYLHFRRHRSLAKYADLLAVIGFIGIIVTFFFARGGNHSYSM